MEKEMMSEARVSEATAPSEREHEGIKPVPFRPVVGPVMSPRLVLLFALACGLSVANIYVAQPLLDTMGRELSISPAAVGMVVTVTQIGYALGLIFFVPLGDLLDPRRLIVSQAAISALALVVVALAPTGFVLLAGMIVVGLLAVVVQVLVAYAATLAAPAERGRIVGAVTSGVVIGILLARFVSGVLADLGGWRLVYLSSAGLMLILAGLLLRTLPRRPRAAATQSYLTLLGSMVALFREEPILRTRAVLAFLIFASFNVLWTPLALPLSAPPLSLSHSAIGLFGLAGVAGALAAGRAGRLADRGLGQWTTGLSLGLMLAAWLPIALMGVSLSALAVGVIMLDLAVQAVHVTNQSLIFAVQPEARSRTVAGYMVFYSIGSAAGGIASTSVYAAAGWIGVCGLGAAINLTALLFWAATRRSLKPATAPDRVRLAEQPGE
jgi:predicted MFS family arabinose efflux permease